MSAEPTTAQNIECLYDAQAERYAAYSTDSFAWQYIERPAYDAYIPDLYTPDTRVLDLCCGTGLVTGHLIDQGVSQDRITGLDISNGQLQQARQQYPEVRYVKAAADQADFPSDSFDLITCNMGLHYFDENQAARIMEMAYACLSDSGVVFIVDSDPDAWPIETESGWVEVMTPWGEPHPLFCRHLRDFLLETAYYAGFDQRKGWTLPVAPEGAEADPMEYERYMSKPSRIGVRLQKVTESTKQFRLETRGQTVPDFSSLLQ